MTDFKRDRFKILKLYASGLSSNHVAKQLGISQPKWLRALSYKDKARHFSAAVYLLYETIKGALRGGATERTISCKIGLQTRLLCY